MGTKARIRGLDQNVTLLNDDIFLSGLELYTQGEGNVRETDSLEGIPSELLGGIDVYKSPNASQSESGLGGIINLKTRSPFDLSGTTLAGNLRYADSGEGWEPLGALVFSHEFSDRLAVMASVSYDKQQFQTDVLGGQNRGDWRLSAIAPTARRCRRTTSRRSIATRPIATRSASAWAPRSRWRSGRPTRPSSRRSGSTPTWTS